MTLGWEEHRKELRRLESELDRQLQAFSRAAAAYAQSSLLRDDSNTAAIASAQLHENTCRSTETEIDKLLVQFARILGECEQKSSSDLASPINPLLQQFRSKYHEFSQEFKKIKGNITATREHAELLRSVRNDIR